MPDRRRFIQGLSSLPLLGRPALAAPRKRDYFKELGIRPFINAAGTYPTLTASLMMPEVVEAINYASNKFVDLIQLQDATGKRIAELIGCEAAMVTAGEVTVRGWPRATAHRPFPSMITPTCSPAGTCNALCFIKSGDEKKVQVSRTASINASI